MNNTLKTLLRFLVAFRSPTFSAITLADFAPTGEISFESDARPSLDRCSAWYQDGKDGNAAAADGWQSAVELLEDGIQPHTEASQLSNSNKKQFQHWDQKRFIDEFQSRPGFFHREPVPALEYRNTLIPPNKTRTIANTSPSTNGLTEPPTLCSIIKHHVTKPVAPAI